MIFCKFKYGLQAGYSNGLPSGLRLALMSSISCSRIPCFCAAFLTRPPCVHGVRFRMLCFRGNVVFCSDILSGTFNV